MQEQATMYLDGRSVVRCLERGWLVRWLLGWILG